MAKIPELVKTYKLLNDPNAPSWSVKFVGGIAIAAIVIAGMGAVYWASTTQPPSNAPHVATATVQDNPDGSHRDYVGLVGSTLEPVDAAQLDAALAQWHTDHPGRTVLSEERAYSNGQLVGWYVTYR